MDFHRIPAENLRDQIFQLLLDNGKIIDGETIDDLKKIISFDDMEQPITDSEDNSSDNTPVVSEVFNDNINDDDVDDESPKPEPKKKEKKPKKEKKEKKEKSDKPSKPASSFVFFKSHPDNQASIEEAAQEINEETGKPVGKVKGAGNVWKLVSEEDKKMWALKSKEAFDNSQTNLAG